MVELASSLSAVRRAIDLEVLADRPRLDLVVVGGGVIGTGIALDAASRGLNTVLIERDDLASGASGRSSRLIHGGTRLLADGRVTLAYESARERKILMQRIAPHMVRPMPTVVPNFVDIPAKQRRRAEMDFRLGDGIRRLTGVSAHQMPRSRRVSSTEAVGLFPALDPDQISSSVLTFDAQIEDDARLVVALARTAASYGATILTRVAATEVAPGRVECVDALTAATFALEAEHIITAVGAWTSDLQPAVHTTQRKGVHLQIPAAALGNPRTSLVLSDERGEISLVPQSDGLVLLGVAEGPGVSPDDLVVDEVLVDSLLSRVNRYLVSELTRADVVGQFAGLRPELIDDRHGELDVCPAISVTAAGNYTVLGGDLTTYRKTAEQVVDRLVDSNMMWSGDCKTADLPLVGAASARRLADITENQRLVRRYGTEAPAVMALAEARPELRERVVLELPVVRAELQWAIDNELAMTAEDLIDRRTRIGLTSYRDAGLEVAQRMLDMAAARTP